MIKNNKTLTAIIISCVIFVAVLGLDMWTKNWVRTNMPMNQYPQEEISVSGEWLTIIHVENKGVAFSIQVPWLKYVSILAILIIGYFFVRIIREEPKAYYNYYIIALIFAGAIGNFIDRIGRGMVTDMIKVDLGFRPFNPFAIFNIADSAVTVGVILYLIFNFVNDTKNKKQALTTDGQ